MHLRFNYFQLIVLQVSYSQNIAFSKITLFSVVANYRHRDSLRRLWVGAVDLCLTGLR